MELFNAEDAIEHPGEPLEDLEPTDDADAPAPWSNTIRMVLERPHALHENPAQRPPVSDRRSMLPTAHGSPSRRPGTLGHCPVGVVVPVLALT